MEGVDKFGRRIIYADHELTQEESLLLQYGEAVLYPRSDGATPKDGREPSPSNGEKAMHAPAEDNFLKYIVWLLLLATIGLLIFGFYDDAKGHHRPVKEEIKEFFKNFSGK